MDANENANQPNHIEPITPEIVSRTPPPPRPRGRRSYFGCLGWAGLLVCLMIIGFQTIFILAQGITVGSFDIEDSIQEKFVSHERRGRDKVAIITVSGVIMEGDGFVKRQIDRARKDDKVKALVIRIDSPGGTVTASDFIYHHLGKLRDDNSLPIVVSMGSVAASGGYYIAMVVGDQEDSIFAEPTTTTGSIGVIIPHYDITGLMQEWGIENDSIASHRRKQMLSMTKKLSDEDREILEAYLNETFKRFKEIVRSGRPALRDDDERLTELATGEIFTATQAQRHGLVDKIGFVEEAVNRAIELAGLDEKNVRVVRYARPKSLFELASSAKSVGRRIDLASFLELSVPKAYYLTTSLPALVSTRNDL